MAKYYNDGFSESALRMHHAAIRNALEAEDSLPAGAVKPYGVREHADFREMAEELEADFDKRGLDCTKISWEV